MLHCTGSGSGSLTWFTGAMLVYPSPACCLCASGTATQHSCHILLSSPKILCYSTTGETKWRTNPSWVRRALVRTVTYALKPRLQPLELKAPTVLRPCHICRFSVINVFIKWGKKIDTCEVSWVAFKTEKVTYQSTDNARSCMPISWLIAF